MPGACPPADAPVAALISTGQPALHRQRESSGPAVARPDDEEVARLKEELAAAKGEIADLL